MFKAVIGHFIAVIIALYWPSFANADKKDFTAEQQGLLCEALGDPHVTTALLLPTISDENTLKLLKSNYSELLTWLSQKADATAETSSKPPVGAYGAQKNQTPSTFLFGQEIIEVNRTAVGILALKWLLAGDYDMFTRNQAPPVKISKESFAKLRDYVMGILKTPEDVDAMIVMLLTNDLGKVKRYHEITEKASGRAVVDHDELLFVGFKEWPEIAPSFVRLSKKHQEWIIDGLKMGSNLNIGQFAQAENLPANLEGVTALKGKPEAFEFKFVELLLDVAGANGHMDSGGAKSMIEPVFKSFMLARTALLEVIKGKSVREAYDQILIAKNKYLVDLGMKSLDVNKAEERTILRLLTMRRTLTLDQAKLLIEVFHNLPENVKTILIRELNIDGTTDGWGILPYYAPALIVNTLGKLQPEATVLATSFFALARVMQMVRIELKGKEGSGVATVNVKPLADIEAEIFKARPMILQDIMIDLFRHQGDAIQFGLKLSDAKHLNMHIFPKLSTLSQLPGQKIAVIGIGGGSDAVQAAQLALMLKNSGKQVSFVGSVRSATTSSQSASGQIGEARSIESHGGEVVPGVFRVLSTSKGSGRFLEHLPADLVPMYLVVERGGDQLNAQLNELIEKLGGVDTVIAVDTGGDALYSTAHSAQDESNATPDQDLRVLQALKSAKVQYRLSAEIAVGVDSPSSAQTVLSNALAQYYHLSEDESALVRGNYANWHLDGSDPRYYGKTPLAWVSALQNHQGVVALPLPTRVVLDGKNPWNPFVNIQEATAGIFFMNLDDHLNQVAP